MEVMNRFGARPMSLGLFGGEQFYLYGILQSSGRVEQLMLAAEGVSAAAIREAIEDALRRQTPGFLKTVGVVAPQPSIPPEIMMQLQMQGRMPPQPPGRVRPRRGQLRRPGQEVPRVRGVFGQVRPPGSRRDCRLRPRAAKGA